MSRKRRRRSPYSISIENAKNSGMEKWLYDFPGPGLVLFSSGLKSGGLLIWFERRRARVDLLFQSRRTKYGESSFESRLIDHGRTTAWSSLSLSLWNSSRNRRSYVSRISTTSDFQSSYASNPSPSPLRSLIESTRLKRRYREEFVSLPPSSTIEPTTIFFRNSFRESRRIYESVFFFFSSSVLDRGGGLILESFRPSPPFLSKESKRWKCLRAVCSARNKFTACSSFNKGNKA